VRLAAKEKMGFYPLPPSEATRIRRFLRYPKAGTMVDPCVGDGLALGLIANGAAVHKVGIELDAGRFQQALQHCDSVIHGDALNARAPRRSIGALFLNPPYDSEASFQTVHGLERMETLFLDHTLPWLKKDGVLIFVFSLGSLPQSSHKTLSWLLASHFREIRLYRLTDPVATQYRQVVLFGIRDTAARPSVTRDLNTTEVYYRLLKLGGHSAGSPGDQLSALPALGDSPDYSYAIPSGPVVTLTHRGLPLDEIEDLLPASSAYRSAEALLFGVGDRIEDRPLTPLHRGHVGLLCTSGLMNGIFGEGAERHVANWRTAKLVETIEDSKEIRRKERYSTSLSLVFADGRILLLK